MSRENQSVKHFLGPKNSGNKDFFSQKSGGYQKFFSIKVVLYSVLNGLNHEDSAIKC